MEVKLPFKADKLLLRAWLFSLLWQAAAGPDWGQGGTGWNV